MTLTSENISNAVAAIYEAAYDQNQWRVAMKAVGDLFDGSRACILRQDGQSYRAVGSYDDDLECAALEALAASRYAEGLARRPVGEVFRRSDVLDDREFHSTALWNDFFQPRNMNHNIGCNLLRKGAAFWTIDVARAFGQGEFEQAELALLRDISRHVVRAGRIGDTLQGAVMMDPLHDGLPFAVMIVDRNRRLYHANRAARALLARDGMPVGERGGRLVATDATTADDLGRLIESACGPSFGGGVAVLPAMRPDVRQPRLLISVAPLSPTLSFGLPDGRSAAVMVREIGAASLDESVFTLARAFRLSPAEARIAAGLAEGKALPQLAAEQNIKVKSARTYLDKVFRKTGTHRQSELVVLLKSAQPLPWGSAPPPAYLPEDKV